MSRDLYDILGVDKHADTSAIKKAYRRLAKEHHPDSAGEDPESEMRFAEIQRAFDVLSDPISRNEYDLKGQPGIGGKTTQSQYNPYSDPSAHDPDILDRVFNAFKGKRGRRPEPAPRSHNTRQSVHGEDLLHTVQIPFSTAALGGKVTLHLRDADGKEESIDVPVPRAVENGAEVRVEGKGHPPQEPKGKPGDLVVSIIVEPHDRFRREALDLYVAIDIRFDQAILGGNVAVPTLNGYQELPIPPNTSAGDTIKLRNMGLTDERNKTGDLYAEIRIDTPDTLTDTQRRCVENLRDALDGKEVADTAPAIGHQDVSARAAELRKREESLDSRAGDLRAREAALDHREGTLDEVEAAVNQRMKELDELERALNERQSDLDKQSADVERRGPELDAREEAVEKREQDCENLATDIEKQAAEAHQKSQDLEQRTAAFEAKVSAIEQRIEELDKQQTDLEQREAELVETAAKADSDRKSAEQLKKDAESIEKDARKQADKAAAQLKSLDAQAAKLEKQQQRVDAMREQLDRHAGDLEAHDDELTRQFDEQRKQVIDEQKTGQELLKKAADKLQRWQDQIEKADVSIKQRRKRLKDQLKAFKDLAGEDPDGDDADAGS